MMLMKLEHKLEIEKKKKQNFITNTHYQEPEAI
jgi:hypothetical protein